MFSEFGVYRRAGLGLCTILLILIIRTCLLSGGSFAIKQNSANSETTIKETTSILQQNPSNYDAYTRRGDAYYALFDTSKALQDYSAAISIMPSAALYRKRADAYGLMGNADLAQQDRAIAATLK